MTHPLIPKILELAGPIAQKLALEVVTASFQTNRQPPVLRLDIRNPSGDTGLNDCEQMSRLLEATLDSNEIIPGAYVLEISSPGISRKLVRDREFEAFIGFDVTVKTEPAYKKRKEWQGKLQGRDEKAVYINQKGRSVSIPRECIIQVELFG